MKKEQGTATNKSRVADSREILLIKWLVEI